MVPPVKGRDFCYCSFLDNRQNIQYYCVMKVWCLFEQSGTFKKEFKSFGIDAIDVDILNEFGETDRQIDLFDAINKAYDGQPSIFDEIRQEDLIFAFFPCTRFTEKVPLILKAGLKQMVNWDDATRLEYSRKTMREINDYYQLVCKMWLVCIRNRFRLVMENPANTTHSLATFFPIKPTIVHPDRSKYGDYFTKATQYWFLNIEPKYNFFLEDLQTEHVAVLDKVRKGNHASRYVLRSMISPVYANRFIREYLLEESYTTI